MELAGIPTVLVISDIFTGLARLEAKVKGLPEMRIVVIPHPLGGNTEKEVRDKADLACEALLPLLGVS